MAESPDNPVASALNRLVRGVLLVVCVACASTAAAFDRDLTELSLEDLTNVEVTSVSKTAEKRNQAAAAIAVITGEDIRRTGATSIPEALRLAPGLHVGRINTNSWSVSSRGFAGSNSSKLLVLMDGRSIYTPLFSGVFWDAQDMMLADVDRIEVIRGPGGTLWGANAMNGVINIDTKSARDTHGGLVEAGGGNEERGFGAFRYGAQLGDDFHYRVFANYFDRAGGFNPDGPAHDTWRLGHVGFRSDFDATRDDALTLQGDLYDGEAGLLRSQLAVASPDGTPLINSTRHDTDLAGGNVLGRWRRTLSAASDLTLQAYYDRTERRDPAFIDVLDTFDVDLQHRLPAPFGHEIVWGIGYRLMSDTFRTDTPVVALRSPQANDQLVSGFVQDEIALFANTLRFTIGTKLERNDYSGFEVQPSGRVAWTPDATHTTWAAVSRAVRTPTRIERDFLVDARDPSGDLAARLDGNRSLRAEKLTSLELGYRWQPLATLFVDVATFYNLYDDLVTMEIGTPSTEGATTIFPLSNRNEMHGDAYGGEVALNWAPVNGWRLAGSYSALVLELATEPGSNDTSSGLVEDASPQHQIEVHSFVDLPRGFELDTMVRWVDELSSPEGDRPTPSYWNADVRLGWRGPSGVELSVAGQNLLDDHHEEFPGGTQVERGVYGKLSWRFGG